MYLKLFLICHVGKQKECPLENRYPLRSKSKVSTHTEGNITSELSTQEIEPSPNKRPKLELFTILGMYYFLYLNFDVLLLFYFCYVNLFHNF